MTNVFTPRGPARFKHQRQGLHDLIVNRGVHALLFDPGLGKTSTVLDYASLLALKADPNSDGERVARLLVAAPLAATDTWTMQAVTYVADGVTVRGEVLSGSIRQKSERMAHLAGKPFKGAKPRRRYQTTERTEPGDSCRLEILVINLEAFGSRARVTGTSKTAIEWLLEGIKRWGPDLLVVDESHRIKSYSSNTSLGLYRAAQHARRRVILTGTVIPHSPLDVFGQWRFLDPDAFGTNYARFRNRYAEMGGYLGKEIKGFRNLDEMQQIMAARSTVARKDEALDLPPVTDTVVPVHLSPREARAYEELKKNLRTELDTGGRVKAPNRLSMLMRLRQITSGHLPTDHGIETVGDSKVRTITSLVNDSLTGERRVVVFCTFTHEITQLAASLRTPGTTVEVISGETPVAERVRIRERFGSDSPDRIVLVAQTRTMSLAVNELVTASHAVFASLPWQRDDIEQARARLDRQGQTRPVTIWWAIAPGTVDQIIYEAYRDRSNLEARMLDHISR